MSWPACFGPASQIGSIDFGGWQALDLSRFLAERKRDVL